MGDENGSVSIIGVSETNKNREKETVEELVEEYISQN